MFASLAGIPLSEYIRRRRLTAAAFELKNSRTKVIDIAIKYGYNSPDAFTRAFQSLHGVTPTDARKNNYNVRAYSPMTFQLSIGGSIPMDYRIVEMDSMRLIGIKTRTELVPDGEHPGVVKLWQSTDDSTYNLLKSLSNGVPEGILHVNEKVDGREDVGDYSLAVTSNLPCPKQFTEWIVSPSTWVVFEIKVPWEKEKWHRIYSEWFPSSGYEQAEGPTIQAGPGFEIIKAFPNFKPDREFEVEHWIPIKKRE